VPGDPPVLILTGPPGAGKDHGGGSASSHAFPTLRSTSTPSATLPFHPLRSRRARRSESNDQNRVVMRIRVAGGSRSLRVRPATSPSSTGSSIPGWFLERLRDALHEAGHGVAPRGPPGAPARVHRREWRESGRGGEPRLSGALEQLRREVRRPRCHRGEPSLDPSEENADGVAEALFARQLEDGRLLI
jgi:hypothetical protein